MRFSPSFAGAAAVATAVAAALILAGCGAAPTSSQNPAPQTSVGEPKAADPRPLDEGALVGVIQYSFVATSWDEDEVLLSDLLRERGFDFEGVRNISEDQTFSEKIDEWARRGAAAIVVESQRWDEDAASVAQAREAGVRFISYVKRPAPSVPVDAHVGVQDGAYARAQLQTLVEMLEGAGTPKPWHIANIGTSAELGDGDLQRGTDVRRAADNESAIAELVEAGVLADAGDVIVHDYQSAKETKASKAATLRWIDEQADLAGIVLADSASTWLMYDGPEKLPIVGLGGTFDGVESVVRSEARATVYVSASKLVEGVGSALDALASGTANQLPTLVGDFATPVPLVAIEPVVVTHDNWETALADDESMLEMIRSTAAQVD
ncbi:hypothetical protein GCM10010401_09400 [Rarobacter faecitabidus]|uniref:ABC-type xylose transport system substrate-binding protein n=1 Tax=Rarobacter faecitabidus TaxID=13243 RepID=A0A542ZA89_RARFA|nr:substrate-binding domain-containing protein [Rarobacter faecitabidus]TQL57235.1 ABC-type xylose transport system substrate-binding protein [Rarobacter faecitabidus]